MLLLDVFVPLPIRKNGVMHGDVAKYVGNYHIAMTQVVREVSCFATRSCRVQSEHGMLIM